MSLLSILEPPKEKTTREKYLEARAAGRELYVRILDYSPIDPARAAKSMTLPVVGKTLIFRDELVMAAFHDFVVYEWRRPDGQTPLERFDESTADLPPLELEILQASRNSRTSLFKLSDPNPAAGTIVLHDLLVPTNSAIVLTDIQFSASIAGMINPPVVFIRLVSAHGVNMTGGFFFTFAITHLAGLLEAHRQKLKKVPARDLSRERFVFFFNKFRKIGSPAELGRAY